MKLGDRVITPDGLGRIVATPDKGSDLWKVSLLEADHSYGVYFQYELKPEETSNE